MDLASCSSLSDAQWSMRARFAHVPYLNSSRNSSTNAPLGSWDHGSGYAVLVRKLARFTNPRLFKSHRSGSAQRVLDFCDSVGVLHELQNLIPRSVSRNLGAIGDALRRFSFLSKLTLNLNFDAINL